ncbi:MAG: C40 family peptidase [Actinobacteria bacterium]|nr:C40 family peptidase [Actinomycetota bacterium]
MLAVAVLTCGLLVGIAGSAIAAPAPTLSQAQAKLRQLQAQFDKLSQQYDSVQQQLTATNQKLAVIKSQASKYQAAFTTLQKQVAQIAVAAYEDPSLSNSLTLLSSGSPQQILNQASILQQLSTSNNAKVAQFLADAKALTVAQAQVLRARVGIESLKKKLATQRQTLSNMVAQETALVQRLSPAAAAQAAPGVSGTTSATFTGSTATQGGKAVQAAYARLGCPYLFGGTTCQPGYDCSGLTQAVWAVAGVSIPRTSEEQFAQLPHVALANIQPGDLLVFNAEGHVGIYVGVVNGVRSLIDAPHSGVPVELVQFTGWYQTTFDGAVRP